MQEGWLCPACSAVWAPFVKKCENCQSKTSRTSDLPAKSWAGIYRISRRLQDEDLGFMPQQWTDYQEVLEEAHKQYKAGGGSTMVLIHYPDGSQHVYHTVKG